MPALKVKVLTSHKDKRRHDGTVVSSCMAVTNESRIVTVEGRGDIVKELEKDKFLFLSEYRTSYRKARMVIRLMEMTKVVFCNIVQLICSRNNRSIMFSRCSTVTNRITIHN